jgi:hypothetical protein
MHGFAFDETSDGDDGVEGRGRRLRCRGGGEGGEVSGRGAEEVASGEGRGLCGLDLRRGEESSKENGQLDSFTSQSLFSLCFRGVGRT